MQKNRIPQTFLFLAILLGAFVIPLKVRAQDSDPKTQLIGYVNAYRQTKGIGQLTANDKLSAAAQAQADYLAQHYVLGSNKDGTVGDRGTLPKDRAYQYGYAPWEQYDVVELWIVLNNSYPLEKVVTNDWWRTSYNQKNLLDGWGTTHADIGVGITMKDQVTYYIVDIGVVLNTAGKVYVTSTYGDLFSYVPIATCTPNADGSVVHTVQEGDSLELVALSYGVTVAQIQDYNGIASNAMMLRPGQTLVIRKPYGDTSTGVSQITATDLPTATATMAATYTLRPHATVTPSPSMLPPTATATSTPKPPVSSQISAGGIGLIAVLIGLVGLVVFFVIYLRRHH
jgi:LysM repeat protein